MAVQHMVPLWRLELVRERNIPYQKIGQVEDAAQVFHDMLDNAHIEKLAVIHLNSGDEMIGAEMVATGRMESVGCAFADLFRGAIRNNAARIWIAHNHVDGMVEPSLPDYRFTHYAIKASKLLEIPVMDYLVVGPGAHYSIFRHKDLMDKAINRIELEESISRVLGNFAVPPKP